MRCSYCGGLNPDRASFCAHCGRDLSVKTSNTAATQNPTRQVPPPPGRPTYAPPQQPYQPQQVPPAPPGGRPARPAMPPVTPQKAPGVQQMSLPTAMPGARPTQPAQSMPSIVLEPPTLFPPRTVEQLKQLEQSALAYTVVNEATEPGHKKVVSIMYARCAPWQQVATLLRAAKEQDAANADTVIIQGFINKDSNAYHFSNGWLQFDRNVRLGGQTQNRYQIETGNGFDTDSVRIVISE